MNAKRASFELFQDSEELLAAAESLNVAYENELGGRTTNFLAMAIVSFLAFVVLLLIGKTYLDDSRRRAEESERQNRENQTAIQRLLDEISNLANGDLTVRAQVTEHMTGAIADHQLHDRRAAAPGGRHHERVATGDQRDAGANP